MAAAEAMAVVGLSHRTAPIAVRERVAILPDALPARLRALRNVPGVAEAMVVSTCNRTEVYVVGAESADAAAGEVRRWLALSPGAPDLAPHLYEHQGRAALLHLFRVASSLDSMVVGEPQILGQVKDAWALAHQSGVTGPILERASARAFAAAKRVRTETGIARAAVSLSFVAVELARKIFGSLAGRRVLLVGAGKMGELAARHLAAQGATEVLVANRSPQRAEELAAAIGGTAHTLADVALVLERVDVAIVSTAAQEIVVGAAEVQAALKARRSRPILIVDLGVPRNVDPAVNDLANAYLYDIDDLNKVVDQNKGARAGEAERAEALLAGEVEEFLRAERGRGAAPVIAALRQHALALAAAEAHKTLAHAGQGLTEKQKESVLHLAEAIVAKLLHAPSVALKAEREAGGPGPLAEAAERLFGVSAGMGLGLPEERSPTAMRDSAESNSAGGSRPPHGRGAEGASTAASQPAREGALPAQGEPGSPPAPAAAPGSGRAAG